MGLTNHIKFSIIGRPNVGKSSLVNALLNEERVIVSNVAGTTRDAIDTPFTYHGENFTVIDKSNKTTGDLVYTCDYEGNGHVAIVHYFAGEWYAIHGNWNNQVSYTLLTDVTKNKKTVKYLSTAGVLR